MGERHRLVQVDGIGHVRVRAGVERGKRPGRGVRRSGQQNGVVRGDLADGSQQFVLHRVPALRIHGRLVGQFKEDHVRWKRVCVIAGKQLPRFGPFLHHRRRRFVIHRIRTGTHAQDHSQMVRHGRLHHLLQSVRWIGGIAQHPGRIDEDADMPQTRLPDRVQPAVDDRQRCRREDRYEVDAPGKGVEPGGRHIRPPRCAERQPQQQHAQPKLHAAAGRSMLSALRAGRAHVTTARSPLATTTAQSRVNRPQA